MKRKFGPKINGLAGHLMAQSPWILINPCEEINMGAIYYHKPSRILKKIKRKIKKRKKEAIGLRRKRKKEKKKNFGASILDSKILLSLNLRQVQVALQRSIIGVGKELRFRKVENLRKGEILMF